MFHVTADVDLRDLKSSVTGFEFWFYQIKFFNFEEVISPL